MFRVRWQKSISRKLLDECAKVDSSLLSEILNAMEEVVSILRTEPEFVGESRDPDKRILVVKPLTVTYKIDYRQRAVYIVGATVRRTKR